MSFKNFEARRGKIVVPFGGKKSHPIRFCVKAEETGAGAAKNVWGVGQPGRRRRVH